MYLKSLVGAIVIAVLAAHSLDVSAQLPDFSRQTLSFLDVTASGVNQINEQFSNNEKEVEFGDYDNDGDLDVAIAIALSDFGQRRNKLYRNDDGVLNEVSGTNVIPEFASTDTSRSIFFRDFDKDGFLDLVVVNCSNSGTGTNTSPGKTKFFRNVNGESFVNESERLGGLTGGAGNGVAADFDGNEFCDLLLANHPNTSQDSLALNNVSNTEPGQFSVVTNTNFPNETRYGVHAEAADMNGDGKLDILVGNSLGSIDAIHYNNNDDAGSGLGDFRYGGNGSQWLISNMNLRESVLIPADFNMDGMVDFFYSNVGTGNFMSDVVMLNIGNDEFNRAIFKTGFEFPDSLDTETMKATVSDLDVDGRPDLVIMSQFRRPYIFRNSSENGEISFVEWTPPVFTMLHRGWQANSANLVGESRKDVFVGAFNDDFLFENVESDQFTADSLAGGIVLPIFHNAAPISITGQVEFGGTKNLLAVDLPAGARVSVLLRSIGDLNLTATASGIEIATSNRAGHGVDETLEFVVPLAGNVMFEIGIDGLGFDGNGDGIVNLLDVGTFIDCLSGISNDCDPFDVNDNGDLNLLLVQPFIDAIANAKSSETFVIEFLSRMD